MFRSTFRIAWCCAAAWCSAAVYAAPPRSITEFQEKPVMVQTHDGALHAFFVRSGENKQIVTVRVSNDVGITWGGEDPVME
ncbi:MAG: hypothetical protein FJY92_12540, partial [Candidatus Hydrogenedentes bacterium]|nr:hypothetical protein [Candidatus Hydrogenedentota bacterium]